MTNNSISIINSDGSMTCTDLSTNSVTTMDSNGNVTNSAMTSTGLV